MSRRQTDAELVHRCQRGERTAFDELVERYHGAIFGFVLHRLQDRQAAADVAQEALIEAYRSLGSLREPDKFAAWLRGIATHCCADWLAQETRRAETNAWLDETVLVAEEPDPQQEVERQEVQQTVRAAMQRLSHANRLAVTLFYFDGLSCREVADFCGVSVSAIKSRLHESRRVMKEEMERMENGKATAKETPQPSGWMVYSGSECVDVLFWRKMYSTPLYLSLYPVKRRDDEAFWSQWQHVPERDGLLRLWEYASVINDENGALVGRVPVYTEADHELLAAWHARVSQAIVQRLKGEQAALDELAHDFQGEHPDPDNLRRITVLGRLLGRGVPSVLVEGLLDPAHDWGGLGRAFIWGDQGQGLPPSSGFSTHGCSGGGTHFTTFQVNMKFPGQEVLNEYSRERVIGLLGRLCREPLFRQDLLQREAHTESERARLERMVDELLTVRWLEERESRLTVDLPWLSWSVDADEQRLRGLAERTVEPVAAAAEELKTLAAQCSFARCRFGDVIYVILSKMRYFVVRDLQREGVIPPEPHPLPPGWGAWLYV